jgi:hypothetical protein
MRIGVEMNTRELCIVFESLDLVEVNEDTLKRKHEDALKSKTNSAQRLSPSTFAQLGSSVTAGLDGSKMGNRHLSILNAHSRDLRIRFDAVTHTYYVDGKV